jgi:hypothetical protein
MFETENDTLGQSRDNAGPTEILNSSDTFTALETARLVAMRNRVRRGERNEYIMDYKRLRFALWLYERGRISG